MPAGRIKEERLGQRFGRLVVVATAPNKGKNTMWSCLCDCGNKMVARTETLTNGKTSSCGCYRKERAKAQLGTLHPSWKGGLSKNMAGYVLIKARWHPRVNSGGYVFEHILIMEQKIGRYLMPHETVHHINKVKDDNRPDNLELWTSTQPSGMRASDAPMLFSLSAHDMRGF